MNGFSLGSRLDADAVRPTESAPVPQSLAVSYGLSSMRMKSGGRRLAAARLSERDDGVVGRDGAVQFDGQRILG
jgi:hypothetical protein